MKRTDINTGVKQQGFWANSKRVHPHCNTNVLTYQKSDSSIINNTRIIVRMEITIQITTRLEQKKLQ